MYISYDIFSPYSIGELSSPFYAIIIVSSLAHGVSI
jgi:hypothetical protein